MTIITRGFIQILEDYTPPGNFPKITEIARKAQGVQPWDIRAFFLVRQPVAMEPDKDTNETKGDTFMTIHSDPDSDLTVESEEIDVVDEPSELVERLLTEMEQSGQSEALGVADCLRTIAANGGEQATDEHLLVCAEEMMGWLEYFIQQVSGKATDTKKLVELAEQMEVAPHTLDSVVHNLKSNEAAEINNNGLRAQITYMVEKGGADWVRLQIAGE